LNFSFMEVKALIIEDEYPIALDIEKRLKDMGFEVCGIAGNIADALLLLAEKNYNIVLLDINLEDKKNGIDLAKIINKHYHVPVIFITAYSDKKTFTEAGEAYPMGYIVKPFKNEDLERGICLAINNFKKHIESRFSENSIEKISDYVFIKEKGVIKQIAVNDVLWIEAMDNYSILNTEKERYVVNSFLKNILEKMGTQFVRIHRSHAVAINKIKLIEDNTLYIGNISLNIGQSYKNNLLERMNIL